MDNQPTVTERTAKLKATAYALRDAADTVLAEVQHMEAAAKRFQQRGEKRGRRNMLAATR
jgi:hypothetical protein